LLVLLLHGDGAAAGRRGGRAPRQLGLHSFTAPASQAPPAAPAGSAAPCGAKPRRKLRARLRAPGIGRARATRTRTHQHTLWTVHAYVAGGLTYAEVKTFLAELSPHHVKSSEITDGEVCRRPRPRTAACACARARPRTPRCAAVSCLVCPSIWCLSRNGDAY